MKIIKEGNKKKEFPKEIICKHCGAVLLVEETDIRSEYDLSATGIRALQPPTEIKFFICIGCLHENKI